MIGAGAVGVLIALLAFLVPGATPTLVRQGAAAEPFFVSSRRLLATPAFRWLFIGAICIGFASAPFYAFAAPFLIRTHGFTASQVGVSFGLLQGVMGIIGALAGGRGFDRAARAGHGRVLGPPAILFLVASIFTGLALFAPTGWMTIALLVPAMLSFAFLMPWAFGAAHLVAGEGRQAQASSLVMIGAGLLGPALGPLFVGIISDSATAAGIPNGLGIGLLIVPAFMVLAALAILVANRRVAAHLATR